MYKTNLFDIILINFAKDWNP